MRREGRFAPQIESLLAYDNASELHITAAVQDTAQSLVSATTLKPGTRVGDYEIHELIGSESGQRLAGYADNPRATSFCFNLEFEAKIAK